MVCEEPQWELWDGILTEANLLAPGTWPPFFQMDLVHSKTKYRLKNFLEKECPRVVKKHWAPAALVTGFDHFSWECQEIWDRCFQTCMPKTFPGSRAANSDLISGGTGESMQVEDTGVYSALGARPTSVCVTSACQGWLFHLSCLVLLFVCPWIKCPAL